MFISKQTSVHRKFIDPCTNYAQYSQVQVTDEVRDYLKKPSFDNWQWDDSEMMVLIRQMYIDLGFVTTFNIEVSVCVCSSFCSSLSLFVTDYLMYFPSVLVID